MSNARLAIPSLLASLALAAAPGCVTEEAEAPSPELATTSQSAVSLSSLNAAEVSFGSAVSQTMSASATAAGVALSSGAMRFARAPRDRTLVTGPTTNGKVALLLSKPVSRPTGRYDAGFYELSGTASAPLVQFHHPTLGKITIAPPPPPGTAEFHTPLGHDLCQAAPGSLHDYCEELVACWAYDLFC